MSEKFNQDTIANLYDEVAKVRSSFLPLLSETEQWVIVGASTKDRQYIYIGDSLKTYNDLKYAPFSAMLADYAVRFDSEKDALNYCDYYLRDGENKPIHVSPKRLSEYAEMVIRDAEQSMRIFLDIRKRSIFNEA